MVLSDNQFQRILIIHGKTISTPPELGAKIDAVCRPRQWRQKERLHIPGTKAILHFGDRAVEANIVNISLNGILCDFIFEKGLPIFDVSYITILFSHELNNCVVENIMCKYFRSNVLAWHSDHSPQMMRMVLNFIELDAMQNDMLTDVFENAAKQMILDPEHVA